MDARLLLPFINAAFFILLFRQKKLRKKVFLILLSADLLAGGLLVRESLEGARKEVTRISREQAPEGSRVQLQAETEGKLHDVTITIPGRSVTAEEAKRKLELTADRLDRMILGRNSSLDHVQYDLTLPSAFEEYGVTAEWVSSDPGVLAWNGVIQPDIAANGTDVTISGMLTLGDQSLKVERIVTVFPSKEETNLEKELQAETDRLNKKGQDTDLPQELHGSKVNWYMPAQRYGSVLTVLIGLVGILMPLSDRQKKEEERKKRQKFLEMEYPDLAGKILLLTGAGLSMRRVFERIGQDYLKQANGRENIACREVLRCVKDFRNGVPEGEVYRNFGERCNLPCYRALALLLEQNLSKGGSKMTELLEAEAAGAYARRRRLAREEGEKSEIRMAVPMIMMLMVVMIILIVPAMFSF